MANTLCDSCEATGLPILPVRYVPVPNSVKLALPGWAGGHRVTDVDLGTEHHYALRTLRSGYVYLFYAKHARGSNRWECYSVSGDGCLMKQPDARMVLPPMPEFQCSRQGHSNVRLHYLVIEQPSQCGPTWIAFSEHRWSDETLEAYTGNTKLRNARMQTLHPAAMAGGAKHGHGTPATEAALNEVIEYSAAFGTDQLPHHTAVGTFSKEDGSFDANRLVRQSTRYPWYQRQGQAADTFQSMQERARKPDGTHHMAHVLALWDAVGTTHELNGFRNDAAGWIKLYGDERELQIRALNEIQGLKKALEQRSGEQADRQIAGSDSSARNTRTHRRNPIVRSYFTRPEKHGPVLTALDDQYHQGQISLPQYQAQRSALVRQGVPADRQAEAERQFAAYDEEQSEAMIARGQGAAEFKQGVIAEAWPKYQDRIDPKPFDDFKRNVDRFNAQSDTLLDRRTSALVNWLRAPLLIDSLEDYHPANLNDGLEFEEVVGTAILGIGTHKVGIALLDAWVRELSATVKSNLLWRAIALNQEKGIQELDAALQEAEQHRQQRTEARALAWTGYTAKALKALADIYKRAQGIFDGNLKAMAPGGNKAYGAKLAAVNMRGLDKVAIAAGDRVFRFFRIDALGDFASEKIIQHIFSIRGFVEPADSANLILAQAKKEGLLRQQTLQRLRTAGTFMAADTEPIRSAQAQELSAAWENFKANTLTTGAVTAGRAAIKDARLAVVVMLIEGVNFSKLIGDCVTKGDAKSQWSLVASGLSISSALFDVASVPAKNVIGSSSWTYQKLKLWGGVLSGAGTAIGVGLDWVDRGKSLDKGYDVLAAMYFTKAFLGAASASLTLGVTFSYSAPLVARITGRAVVGIAVREVGKRAAAIVALRILGMAAGGWVTLGIFGVQVIIWIATPNALQDWIAHSAFGKKQSTGGFVDAKQQEEALKNALLEMGLQ